MSDNLPIIEQVNSSTEDMPKTLMLWMAIYQHGTIGWENSILYTDKDEAVRAAAYHVEHGRQAKLVKIILDI